MDQTTQHKEIVEGCKRGSRQAQFDLYRQYSKAMFNICLRMLGNEADAEDVLQNAFIDVFSKLDTFRFESSIGAWIKRIVVNNCINYLKKRRMIFEDLDDKVMNRPEEYPAEEPVMSIEAINSALFQLPEGYRIVFSLYLLEGYDHEEIAGILSISEQTSKSQYSRAKARLREILSQRKGLQAM